MVFILSQLGLAYAVLRFRDHGQRAHFSRGNNTMEFVWTTATIILFLGLGILGRRAWAEVRFTPPAADAVQVEVTENQFVFNFRYPGPDGKFGRLDPKQISASTGNPLGIDSNDPAGKDDIVVPTLTVPVNREVELQITFAGRDSQFLRARTAFAAGCRAGIDCSASISLRKKSASTKSSARSCAGWGIRACTVT